MKRRTGYEKEGKIILTDGHRRMTAVGMAMERGYEVKRVPIIIEKRALTEEERTLGFWLLNDGKPLNMLEQSEVIRRLLNFGWKLKDIVKRTGKARGYIENLVLLIEAPTLVRNYIIDGKISAHTVIQIMQALKGDAAKVIEAVEEAILNAQQAGKDMATPKHMKKQKESPAPSSGKFFKWSEALYDLLVERKDIDKVKLQVLETLMSGFENEKNPEEIVKYFIDKAKSAQQPAAKPTKATKKPVKK
ncbi:MAG: hypothetical protein MUF42_17230 [Cytophagaceae bacterium]|nr:hypothetical protein [Cytophagaceae bacterium]